ncbi:MAG: amidohydrolase family protein [Ignavibacteriae bacterium]|nr:N-ethylammeline chlorohydrolase [Ignavibacteriota bacterium]NOG99455.1 amidohydrolase family protein [Ignavibacteriota bacterium]
MSKKLIIPKQIVTADAEDKIYRNYSIEIEEGIIKSIAKVDEDKISKYYGEVLRYPNLTLVPGFVQTHIHTCQTLFRGLADDLELLDWLTMKIFPYENSHNKESLRASVKLSLLELQGGGTTTVMDMGTMRHQEVIFDEFIKNGMRGYCGKCMIDENELYPDFKETTKESLSESYQLAKEFHNSAEGRIKYGFAPRFVLSCSEELMKETHSMLGDFEDSIFHTHSSENKSEIEAVRKKYGKENIEYFNSIGVLDDHTVLAHCIHLNNSEIDSLKTTQARVAHCPSSNLKLGSGIAQIPRYLNEGIQVSLGADGAPCNNNLSVFTEMRLAALIQKPVHGPTSTNAKTIFRLGTIEGAKALHLDNEVGSIEVGKKADLVLLNLESSSHSLPDDDENIYSNIVYSSSPQDVEHVMINGGWVVVGGKSINLDEEEVVADAKEELLKLLKRSE